MDDAGQSGGLTRPLRVALRANAVASLGGGHVMRCMALARALERGGAETLLLANAAAFNIIAHLEDAAQSCGEAPEDTVRAVRARWAGGADVLVADIYAWGAAEERVLRGCAARVAVIDDLANRAHDAELVIDQTYGRTAQAYSGLASRAIVLAGAAYTMMRPEFSALRGRAMALRAEAGAPRRVLVSMGLTDVGGVTARVVDALLSATPDATLDVLVASCAQSLDRLRALAAVDRRVHLHVDELDVAEIMIAADIAIGGAGTTAWERCCLGLPSVMLIVAENQRVIAENLESAGAALVAEDITTAASHVRALWDAPQRRVQMSKAASALIDGSGGDRVAAVIAALCIAPTEAAI